MHTFSRAMTIGLALLAIAAPGAARAETEAVCGRYAQEAVTAQRHNLRREGCGLRGPMWNESYSAHFDWCRGQAGNVVAAESKKRIDALTECTGRPAHCQRYANAAVVAQNANMAAAKCRKQGARWSNVYNHHYGWCLGQPQAVSQREHDAREADLRACSFESAPKAPGAFAGQRVDGVELAREEPGGRIVSLVANKTFLSPASLCGLWQANRQRLDQRIEAEARGKGYKGFNVRSDVDSKVTARCSAIARMAGGGITAQISLPGNVVYFYLTTPGPIGGWADPKFSITYDVEATLFIRIPTAAGQPFRVEASARIFNLRPNSHNVTGDAARAVASVADFFTGGAVSRLIPQDIPFRAEAERSLGPIANAIPAGYRLEQRAGQPNHLLLVATRNAPYVPPVR
jgi:hypothetical protein